MSWPDRVAIPNKVANEDVHGQGWCQDPLPGLRWSLVVAIVNGLVPFCVLVVVIAKNVNVVVVVIIVVVMVVVVVVVVVSAESGGACNIFWHT